MNTPSPETVSVNDPSIRWTDEAQARPYDERKRLALAGGLLIANAGLAFTELALTTPENGARMFVSIAIDLLIAGTFLKGSGKYRGFAIFRVVLGLLLFAGVSLSAGDYLTPAFVAVGHGGLLLVLVGQPSPGRRILGAVLFGLIALPSLAALLFL